MYIIRYTISGQPCYDECFSVPDVHSTLSALSMCEAFTPFPEKGFSVVDTSDGRFYDSFGSFFSEMHRLGKD